MNPPGLTTAQRSRINRKSAAALCLVDMAFACETVNGAASGAPPRAADLFSDIAAQQSWRVRLDEKGRSSINLDPAPCEPKENSYDDR